MDDYKRLFYRIRPDLIVSTSPLKQANVFFRAVIAYYNMSGREGQLEDSNGIPFERKLNFVPSHRHFPIHDFLKFRAHATCPFSRLTEVPFEKEMNFVRSYGNLTHFHTCIHLLIRV